MSYSFTRRTDGNTLFAAHVNELQVAVEDISTGNTAHNATADGVHGLPTVPVGGIVRRTASGWQAVEGSNGDVLRRVAGVWTPDSTWLRGVMYYSAVNRYQYSLHPGVSNGTLDLDRLILVPVPVDVPMQIDALALRVITGVANAVLRFGLYIPDLAAGTSALATGTEQTASGASAAGIVAAFSAPVAVMAPFVLAGVVCQGAQPTVERLLGGGPGGAASILSSRAVASFANGTFLNVVSISGALPASTDLAAGGSIAPFIGYRRSA
jgi:hypothetical protein